MSKSLDSPQVAVIRWPLYTILRVVQSGVHNDLCTAWHWQPKLQKRRSFRYFYKGTKYDLWRSAAAWSQADPGGGDGRGQEEHRHHLSHRFAKWVKNTLKIGDFIALYMMYSTSLFCSILLKVFGKFCRLAGRYCSYLLPNQALGTHKGKHNKISRCVARRQSSKPREMSCVQRSYRFR